MNSKIKLFITSLVLFFGVTQFDFAQNEKIKGHVVDANSDEALIGANVIIVGTSFGAAADMNGEFVLPRVKPGNYSIKISYVGYKEKIENVTVVANRTTEIIVKLEWIAVEGEVVLVTAQAKGQLSAINEQLSASELKNVVSKDRIRELPDNNAAEAVGRLPGISLTRSSGEGNKVVIRGLQPKYSLIMVDGIPLSATGRGDRSVSMSNISSYSLEGIEVIKSPTANMDGDQIGGSVNFLMKTAPKGFSYEIITEGGYYGLRERISDYNLVANISNRFFDDNFGVFAQISSDQKNMGSNRLGVGYIRGSRDVNTTDLKMRSVGLTNIFQERNRLGGTLTLDYIIPDGKIYLKNFLSSGKTNTLRSLESFNRNHTFTGRKYSQTQLSYSNILSYEQFISDIKIKAKLAHSYSGGETPRDVRSLFYGGAGEMEKIEDYGVPEDVPLLAHNNFDEFLWYTFRDGERKTKGRQITTQLDFEKEFSLSNQINGKIKFGGKFRYNERLHDFNEYSGAPFVASGTEYKDAIIREIPRFNHFDPGTSYFYLPDFIDKDFEHGEFLQERYKLGPVADMELMYQIMDVMRGVYDSLLAKNPSYPGTETFVYRKKTSIIDDYTGTERLGAGYLLADFNVTKFLKFNLGMRYEKKNTRYNGTVGRDGSNTDRVYDPSDTTSSRNNEFLLPMLHMRIKPVDWVQIRVDYTHTIARPNFNNILPTLNYGDERITMKNPNLVPELSKNLDISLSFSDNHLGLLTIGGFWKNINDKIFSRGDRLLLDPTKYGLDTLYKGVKYRTQENSEEMSYVKGFEIDWQTNFWYLPSVLSGIVLNVNYTKIFSETTYHITEIVSIQNPDWYRGCGCPRRIMVENDIAYKGRLLNQPTNIISLGLGYDYKDLSVRLSLDYQADVFSEFNFFSASSNISDDYSRWDLQINQKLPWYGLSVYGKVTNLNRASEVTLMGAKNKIRSENFYDRAIYFGIRWRSE